METLHAASAAASPGASSAAPTGASAGPSLAPAPERILDPHGAPRLGAFSGEVERAEDMTLAASGGGGGLLGRMRWKRWIYVFVGGPRALAGFAIADLGFVGNCFGYGYDRERGGAQLETGWLAPGALGIRVAGGLGSCAASGRTRRHGLTVRAEGVGLRLEGSLGALSADVRIERLDTPLTVISELDGPSCPGATIKSMGLPASGWISIGGRRIDLDGSHAVVDWTCARFGYRTDWNWASMTGTDRSGRPVGLNLCRGVHDGTRSSDHTENALWLDGSPAALPRIEVAVGRGGKEPWRLSGGGVSEGAHVELEFRPLGERSEDVNLGLVRSRFRQPFGTYHGVVRDREGRTVEVDGAVGVVEDHHAKW